MSALARILIAKGYEVSGSDIATSRTVEALKRLGAQIAIGHQGAAVHGSDLVVVSDAIPLEENPETIEAARLDLPRIRRSRLLGLILEGYRVIAVTGSHGKTTTTAVLTQILAAQSGDPLGIVGAEIPAWGGNVRFGGGPFAVVEACEAYEGYFDLHPEFVLLTNLEADHLDYHGTPEALVESVKTFVRRATGEPPLFYCADDEGTHTVAADFHKAISYGFEQGGHVARYEAGTLSYENVSVRPSLIGRHNALNCWGAIVAAAHITGASFEQLLPHLASVSGAERRLEKVGEENGILVYDDYAHHPTEIRASLNALRETYPGRRIVCVYQPHLYSRTQHFQSQFAPVLALADVVVMTDIYPAREEPLAGISSLLIVEDLERRGRPVWYVPSRFRLPRAVGRIAEKGDIVVGMGAGNIEEFPRAFLAELARRSRPLRIAVLAGGYSAEREVSLHSGRMVARALRSKGYDVEEYDPERILFSKAQSLRALVGPERPDLAFLALHGTGAEDGRIQAFLDLLELPYTGGGPIASALAMDKQAAKDILSKHNIPVPFGICLGAHESLPADLPLPAVVKPRSQGSTVGVTFVRSRAELEAALQLAWKYDEAALVEEWVEGVELSVPVVGDEALPPVEIVPKSGTYDFAAKYTPGATEEIVPARVAEEIQERAKDLALRAHRVLGLLDLSRTDLIVRESGELVVLEVNSLPGMTSTSLVPRSAASVGISFEDLCERILHSAMKRYGIA
jgi:UDP-N-acetylmuramate--alanine ligase